MWDVVIEGKFCGMDRQTALIQQETEKGPRMAHVFVPGERAHLLADIPAGAEVELEAFIMSKKQEGGYGFKRAFAMLTGIRN